MESLRVGERKEILRSAAVVEGADSIENAVATVEVKRGSHLVAAGYQSGTPNGTPWLVWDVPQDNCNVYWTHNFESYYNFKSGAAERGNT